MAVVSKISECRDGMVLRNRVGSLVEVWTGFDGRTLMASRLSGGSVPASKSRGLFPAEVVFDPLRTAGSLTMADLGRIIAVSEATIVDGSWVPGHVRIAGISFTEKGVKIRPGRKSEDPKCSHGDYDFSADEVVEFIDS